MTSMTGGPDVTEGRHEDREALRAMLREITTAINTKDWKILDRWLDNDVLITMIDQIALHGRGNLAEYIHSKLGRFNSVLADIQVDPVPDGPAVFHGETAVCPVSSADHFIFRNGRDFLVQNKYTATAVKKEGNWKLVALHGGANAFNNPISYQFQKALYSGIGAVGVAGAALGWLLGRRR